MLTFFNSILLTFKKSLFKLRRILKLELLWTLIPVIVLLLLGIPAFVFFFEITP